MRARSIDFRAPRPAAVSVHCAYRYFSLHDSNKKKNNNNNKASRYYNDLSVDRSIECACVRA